MSLKLLLRDSSTYNYNVELLCFCCWVLLSLNSFLFFYVCYGTKRLKKGCFFAFYGI